MVHLKSDIPESHYADLYYEQLKKNAKLNYKINEYEELIKIIERVYERWHSLAEDSSIESAQLMFLRGYASWNAIKTIKEIILQLEHQIELDK